MNAKEKLSWIPGHVHMCSALFQCGQFSVYRLEQLACFRIPQISFSFCQSLPMHSTVQRLSCRRQYSYKKDVTQFSLYLSKVGSTMYCLKIKFTLKKEDEKCSLPWREVRQLRSWPCSSYCALSHVTKPGHCPEALEREGGLRAQRLALSAVLAYVSYCSLFASFKP